MKEILRIHVNQDNNFLPLDLYYGSDILHPVQLFSTTVFTKKDDGQNKVNSIMNKLSSDQQPVLEYYNFHGIQREAPIVHSEKIYSYDYPYPHDEITIIFTLSAEQIQELHPSNETGEFGY